VRVRVGVLVRDGVRVAVGVRDGVRATVDDEVAVGVPVSIGVDVPVCVAVGVWVRAGEGVTVYDGVMDGGVEDEVGDGVAVAVGGCASKRISAVRSAAVIWPSSFTSAPSQPPSMPLKIASMTAPMSAVWRTPSQLAPTGASCASTADAHVK
jgi:hypothetical protein